MGALALLFDDALGVAPLKSVGAVKAWVIIQCILCPPDTNLQPVLWEPLCPKHRDLEGQGHCCTLGQSPGLCGPTRWVQAGLRLTGSTFPWNTQLAGLRFVTGVQPSDVQLPGSTEIATEGWRGKGLKSFPFTLCKYARHTREKEGMSGMLLGGGTAVCFLSSPRVQPL